MFQLFTDFEGLAHPRGSFGIKRPEACQLHKLLLFDVRWREHCGDILPLKVHDNEAIEATKLRHIIDQKLAIALDFGARISLQSQMM